jgi:hypothetical protein
MGPGVQVDGSGKGQMTRWQGDSRTGMGLCDGWTMRTFFVFEGAGD